MRGTDDLSPAQRPSGLKRTRRTQPYRRKSMRPPGPTLSAMLKGAPIGLPNPMDMQRRMVKRRGR
jgi:hypothetical protein